MNILFTGVGRRVELLQAYREAALELGQPLLIWGADSAGTAPALAWCSFTRRVLPMRDPGYIPQLLQLCASEHIDLLIPTIDTDLLVLSEHREEFLNIGTRVLISAPEMIRLCRDKNLTSRFFEQCGLRAPMPVNSWQEYTGGFPAFIKPKDGSSSINAFRADSAKELELYARQIGDYIVQPFVEGTEYTIDIFSDWEGNPLSIVPRQRMQVRAGEVLKTRIEMDDTMIREAEALCRHFRPCGPLTVQLIRDRQGTDWYIEINPRYGGGSPLSMKAGARSALYALQLLRGEKPAAGGRIADGAVYSRFDQSVCITEGQGSIRGVIFDLDDTLYNEKDYVRSGFKAVSDALGGGFEQRLWAFFEAGRPAVDELLRELGRGDEKQKLLEVYRSHMPAIQLLPGVREALAALRARGIRVGILTDGRPEGQWNKLRALGLESLADDILITDELGGPQFRKPCDIAFRILQTRWRLPAAEIVYVGDNPVKDFQAPRQLGMKCLRVDNPEGLYAREDDDQSIPRAASAADILSLLADEPTQTNHAR